MCLLVLLLATVAELIDLVEYLRTFAGAGSSGAGPPARGR